MLNPFGLGRAPQKLFEAYLLLYASLFLLFAYLSPIAFSVVLTAFAIIIVLEPVAGWLIRRRRMRFAMANALTLIVFFSCVMLLFLFLVPSTLKEANGFFRFVEDFFRKTPVGGFFSLESGNKGNAVAHDRQSIPQTDRLFRFFYFQRAEIIDDPLELRVLRRFGHRLLDLFLSFL